MAILAQLGADIGRAPVLPDDSPVNRLAARTLPDDGRFALIGDANGSNIIDAKLRSLNRLARRV